MKITILSLISAAFLVNGALGITVFSDAFSTNTLSTNYTTQGVAYNSTPQTITINRATGNFLEIAQTFSLDSYGATQLTIAFDYSFGASMFGSDFDVQYNDNTGTGWQQVANIGYTGTGANDSQLANNAFSITINEGATYTFANGASIRLIDTNNSGSKGYHIDNFTISVDAVPEPSVAILSALGCFMLLRRRRA